MLDTRLASNHNKTCKNTTYILNDVEACSVLASEAVVHLALHLYSLHSPRSAMHTPRVACSFDNTIVVFDSRFASLRLGYQPL